MKNMICLKATKLSDYDREKLSQALSDIGSKMGIIFCFVEDELQFMDREETLDFFEHLVKKLKEMA